MFVLVVLAHRRRRVMHFNVTEHPSALWTGQQMVEASPEATAPGYLLRDRDRIYGREFRERIQSMNIEEVLSAPGQPLAAGLRGEIDRIDPARLFGSCDRAWRRTSAKDLEKLFGVLSAQPDSLRSGQRYPWAESASAAKDGKDS
jgi:hypothetical protein